MADKRKLQGDIDRTLKRVQEGRTAFQEILDKFEAATNHTQKEKFEADLKKEIKKLQRFRDQIKTWLNSNGTDKQTLTNARKEIESDMERFKVIEKETKTKAYSKEGLITETKKDPFQKEKDDLDEFLKQSISSLNEQKERMEFDIEGLASSTKKKRIDKDKQSQIDEKRKRLESHQFHIDKIELIMRLLDNERLDFDLVKSIREDVEFYIENFEETEWDACKEVYDDLNLDELCDIAGAAAGTLAVSPNDSENMMKMDNDPTASRSSSPLHSMLVMECTSISSNSTATNDTASVIITPGITPLIAPSVGGNHRERRKSEEKSNQGSSGYQGKNHGKSAGNTPLPGSGPVSTPLSMPISSGPVLNIAAATADYTASLSASQAATPTSQPISSLPVFSSAPSTPANGVDAQRALNLDSSPQLSQIVQGTTTVSTVPELAPVGNSQARSQQSATPVPTHDVDQQQSQKQMSVPSSSQQLHPMMSQPQQQQRITQSPSPQIPVTLPPTSMLPPSSTPSQSVPSIPQLQQHIPISMAEMEAVHKSISSSSLQQTLPSQASHIANAQALVAGLNAAHQHLSGQHTPADLKAIAAKQADLLRQHQHQQHQHQSQTPPSYLLSSQAELLQQQQQQQVQQQHQLMSEMPSTITLDVKDSIAPFRNKSLQNDKVLQQLQTLESGYKKLPHPGDTDRARMILYKIQATTPQYYPKEPPKNSDCEDYYMKLDSSALFFIFYYFEGTKAQYLAAKALKKMSWRFHTKFMMWFQRHEEPKSITDEYESGTYIYYDTDSMSQRKKENFMFEYAFLEDKDF